jgi:hypothetical protein
MDPTRASSIRLPWPAADPTAGSADSGRSLAGPRTVLGGVWEGTLLVQVPREVSRPRVQRCGKPASTPSHVALDRLRRVQRLLPVGCVGAVVILAALYGFAAR